MSWSPAACSPQLFDILSLGVPDRDVGGSDSGSWRSGGPGSASFGATACRGVRPRSSSARCPDPTADDAGPARRRTGGSRACRQHQEPYLDSRLPARTAHYLSGPRFVGNPLYCGANLAGRAGRRTLPIRPAACYHAGVQDSSGRSSVSGGAGSSAPWTTGALPGRKTMEVVATGRALLRACRCCCVDLGLRTARRAAFPHPLGTGIPRWARHLLTPAGRPRSAPRELSCHLRSTRPGDPVRSGWASSRLAGRAQMKETADVPG